MCTYKPIFQNCFDKLWNLRITKRWWHNSYGGLWKISNGRRVQHVSIKIVMQTVKQMSPTNKTAVAKRMQMKDVLKFDGVPVNKYYLQR